MKDIIQNYFQGNYRTFYEKYLQGVKKIGGNEYAAICPFHDDREPSLNFNNETGKYFCHGCGKKGHIFHFYARINDLDTRKIFQRYLRASQKTLESRLKKRKAE